MKDKAIWLVALIACGFLVTPLAAQDKKTAADAKQNFTIDETKDGIRGKITLNDLKTFKKVAS